MTLSETIKELALSLGFDACGIAKAEPLEVDGARLKAWVDAGRHGQMRFMEQYMEMREDPTILMEGCRSMIMVLINYNPSYLQPSAAPQIAKYAYGKDYHWVIKERLHDGGLIRMDGSPNEVHPIPYALFVAVICTIGYIIAGVTKSAWITMSTSIVLLLIALFVVNYIVKAKEKVK